MRKISYTPIEPIRRIRRPRKRARLWLLWILSRCHPRNRWPLISCQQVKRKCSGRRSIASAQYTWRDFQLPPGKKFCKVLPIHRGLHPAWADKSSPTSLFWPLAAPTRTLMSRSLSTQWVLWMLWSTWGSISTTMRSKRSSSMTMKFTMLDKIVTKKWKVMWSRW